MVAISCEFIFADAPLTNSKLNLPSLTPNPNEDQMDSMEKKIDYYSHEILRGIDAVPKGDRYGFLLSALEDSVKHETDRGFLAVIAVQLQELSDDALKRSGIDIICPINKKTVN